MAIRLPGMKRQLSQPFIRTAPGYVPFVTTVLPMSNSTRIETLSVDAVRNARIVVAGKWPNGIGKTPTTEKQKQNGTA
jgi:hypothetical protein